jgi:hypothetical protein
MSETSEPVTGSERRIEKASDDVEGELTDVESLECQFKGW